MEPKGKNAALNKFNKLFEAHEKAFTSKKRKSKARGKEALLRPLTGECQGWAFHVPRCFNAALDITFDVNVTPPCWKQMYMLDGAILNKKILFGLRCEQRTKVAVQATMILNAMRKLAYIY